MLGPVFHAELLTTARRRRYYALRVLYGMVLLGLIWTNYETTFRWFALTGTTVSISRMSDFAQRMFRTFSVTQAVVVLFLTPALVSGVIADEKHRKTLHYLLASQLHSTEIVLGKLAARMLHVGVFLALGMPVVSLISLFGGIEPIEIVAVYGVTATTAFFLAGLSLLASTWAHRPRGAIVLAYALAGAWIIGPTVILGLTELLTIMEIVPELTIHRVFPALEWSYPGVALAASYPRFFGGAGMRLPTEWAVTLTVVQELVFGSAFVALSAWRLRPIARSQDGKPRWEIRLDHKGRRRWQLRQRPACGNDPMLWKERYTARIGGVARLAVLFVGLALYVLVGCVVFESGRSAFREMMLHGLQRGGFGNARQELHEATIGFTALVFAVWGLGAAITGSAAVTGEREGDTWISLLSTELTGWEILRAKVFGSVVRFRALGYLLLALWGVGLALGALHPVGVLAAFLQCLVYLGFAAALGVYASLRSRTTTIALVRSVGALILLHGGPILVGSVLGPQFWHRSWLFFTPTLVGDSLLSPPEFHQVFVQVVPRIGWGSWWGYYPREHWLQLTFGVLWFVVPAYALALVGLLLGGAARFDREADRPRLAGPARGDQSPSQTGRDRVALVPSSARGPS